MEPKRLKLRQAQEQLEAANNALAAKQAALKDVVERVEGLRRQLAEAQAEQRRLNEQVRRVGEWGRANWCLKPAQVPGKPPHTCTIIKAILVQPLPTFPPCFRKGTSFHQPVG